MGEASVAPVRTDAPKQWGVVAGTLWVVAAFFLPQFLIVPFVGLISSLPADKNTKQFVLQGLLELAAVLIITVVMKRIYHAGLPAVGLGKFERQKLWWAAAVFPVYLVVSTLVTNLSGVLLPINLDQTQDLGYSNPGGFELVLIFVALVGLAPFVEEVLFRGFLFNAFRRTFGLWAGTLIVSLLFALAHGQANVGIDVFVLSLFLCFVRERTQSLWPSIVLHSLKNLLAFTVLFIIAK